MVWMKHLDSGFGDLLRGTITLYNLSRQMNFELIVDTHLHPVSKILVSHPHRYSNYVMEHQSSILTNTIHMTEATIEQFIKGELRHGHDKPLMLVSNASPDTTTTNDCKRFMRQLLTPTDDFKRYFNDMCNEFHIPPNYSIAHFRLGDQELNDNESDVEQYHKLYVMVDVQLATIPNLYIISDSLTFKTHLRNSIRPELGHRIIPTKPIHLANPIAHDIDQMRETMFDFLLLANARIIKTHSKYTWVSNFVMWVSDIFNIPLFDMKSKMEIKSKMDMKLHVGVKSKMDMKLPVGVKSKMDMKLHDAPSHQVHKPMMSTLLVRTRRSFRSMF
jgi:hypothetical protein